MRLFLLRYPILLCLFMSTLTVAWLTPTNDVAQAQAIDSRKLEADRYYEAGRDRLQRSNLLTAKTEFQKALRIYQTIRDTAGQRNSVVGLAQVDYKLGNYQGARAKLRQTARYGVDRDGKVSSLQGLIELELGDYRAAAQLLQMGAYRLQVSNPRDRLARTELNDREDCFGRSTNLLGSI